MSAKYDFNIEQGADFDNLKIVWKDSQGTPVDLTGARARMQFRENDSGPTLLDLTTENGGLIITSESAIQPFMSAADTLRLNFTLAQYQLEVYRADNTTKRLMSGSVKLSKRLIQDA